MTISHLHASGSTWRARVKPSRTKRIKHSIALSNVDKAAAIGPHDVAPVADSGGDTDPHLVAREAALRTPHVYVVRVA